MKLILAIVNHDDSQRVIRGMTQNGFSVTKLATTGGFLMSGNTTIIAGVDESRLDEAIGIIRDMSHSRTQLVPVMTGMEIGGMFSTIPTEVTVGGATIFVLDVDRFEKV